MTDINAKHLDGAGLSHVFGKIKGALDNRMNDSVEFLYRAVSETEGAPSGLATIGSIHGNTLRWNQLWPLGSNTTLFNINLVTAQTSDNGRTVQITSNYDSSGGKYQYAKSTVIVPQQHVYLMTGIVDTSNTTVNAMFGFYSASQGSVLRITAPAGSAAQRYTLLGTPVASNTLAAYFGIRLGNATPQGEYATFTDVQLFDLTQMFGAGNEPATVAEFEALYPEPYYPYDAGSLLPVRMEGIETVGFNQWDEQWESGTFDTTTGAKASSATGSNRNVNPISVMPNTAYYFNMGGYNIGSSGINVFWYDASMNLVLHENRWSANLTSPAGSHYMNFSCGSSWTAENRGKTCINISDPARNGTYEPYWHSERTIPAATYFPDGLRSAGIVYDELRADAAVTRVRAVDLGTLNWLKNTTNQFYALLPENATSVTTGALNVICTKYIARNVYNGGVSQNGICTTVTAVWVVDTSYTDAATLKAAMDGVMLYYELATPTTTPIDPQLALRYKVDSDGTERIMVDERKDAPQSAPVPMDVTYGISLYDSAVDDGMSIAHVRDVVGEPNPPYTEVEWVESDGTQYVYLDWKPPITTWGFEADFIIRNAFSTTGGAWRSDTNVNGYGNVFGTRNSSAVNDIQLGTYGSTGILRHGSSSYTTSGILKTDKTRQQVSLKGTSLRRGDGTTVTVTRSSETANKPYANMVVFGIHEGIRRGGTGNVAQLGTVRIYSLKFYDGTTLKVDLVGAIRNRDGMTGLYDKVKGHFYPAQGMTYGDAVGTLGVPDTVEYGLLKRDIIAYVDNRTNTRMLNATVPELTSLEDGQQLTVIYSASITASTQTTELAGWDDTSSNANLYLKVTLADGSKTEWIPCYYTNGSRLTSHYGAGTPILMTYRENVFYNATTTAAGTAVMRGWWADPNYNTDDVYTRYSDTLLAGLNGVKRYSLNMRDANGNWTSIMNEDNNTGATGKTAYTGGLMLGNILYHSSESVIAAGGNTGQMKESHGGVDFRYDVNGVTSASGTTELQLRKPVYLVGTVHSDGLFYLDQTKWWTQTSFETGKVYVHIGTAYSSYYAIFLSVNNPSYVWDGSKLVEFDDSRIRVAESKLSGIAAGAEVNQNAFSNVKVGSTTVAADTKTDTLELAGSNVTLTPDATNDKVTIGITASNVTTALGTLPVANGGTGQTTAMNAANSLLNALSTGSSTPVDADYYISQYVGGGTTTTTYHRRPVSALWEYIKGKISSVLGLTNTEYSGNSATTTKLKTARTINVGNKATGTATSFDGSANITVPVNSLLTDALVEPSIVKTGSKTSLPLVDTLKGNKLALLPADQIIIEKTTDGGATWVDYGATDDQKRKLFVGNTIGSNITIPLLNGVKNTNCGVRITFTAMKYNVPEGTSETGKYAYWNSTNVKSNERYCSLQAMYFWVSTNTDGLSCKCEKANGNNASAWTTVFNKDTTEAITGWSGGDYIAFTDQVFGGGTNQAGQAWNWRLTFFTRNSTGGTTLSTSNTGSAQQINRILGYGANGWGTPNQLFATGHLYNWDASANAVFPASIFPTTNNVGSLGGSSLKWNAAFATTFYGNLSGNVTGNVTGNATNVTGTVAIANGGTGATSAANARTNLGVPPTSHASSATTYGTGTDANYGHVKLSGATNSTSGTSGGIAATPSAVKTAYDLANTANGTANTALSGVNGTLIYDHTYTIANGVATFTAHVYCKGEEVTSQYADSAFSWSYRLSDAISETGTPSVVSLGTGKTKTINITTLGLGGHVIGTFTTD